MSRFNKWKIWKFVTWKRYWRRRRGQKESGRRRRTIGFYKNLEFGERKKEPLFLWEFWILSFWRERASGFMRILNLGRGKKSHYFSKNFEFWVFGIHISYGHYRYRMVLKSKLDCTVWSSSAAVHWIFSHLLLSFFRFYYLSPASSSTPTFEAVDSSLISIF